MRAFKTTPLFDEVAAFIKTHELGSFDAFGPAKIPHELVGSKKLNDSFSFIELADGSLVALVQNAVVLLESEGNHRTIANSFEEFLLLWSKGETGVYDLDEGEELGALAKWLKAKKVKAPKAKNFDFTAWLDGGTTKTPEKNELKRVPTADFKKLGPKLRELMNVIGRRADAPELVKFMKKLGKKLPTETRGDSINVVAPKEGLELNFDHDVLSEKYPVVARTPRSFIPYLSFAWIRPKFGERIFGVDLTKPSEAELKKLLGEPVMDVEFAGDTDAKVATWNRVIDTGSDAYIAFEFNDGILEVTAGVKGAASLDSMPTAETNLFIAWAVENEMLDETMFASHAELFAKVKQRKALASELTKAALPRGLWNTHLKDVGTFRDDAYNWFHNFGAFSQRDDFEKLKRVDDGWATVDKVSKRLSKVFDY